MNWLEKISNALTYKKYKRLWLKAQKVIPAVNSYENYELADTLKKNSSNQVVMLALIREAVKRTLGIVPYDEQLIGAAALLNNSIVEMHTGEGKTLSIAMAAAIKALQGHKVHIATVNDYLAKRDCLNMARLYDFLSLKNDYNHVGREDKENCYLSTDILYSSSSELVFDYLRNQLTNPDRPLLPLDTVLIDEIDFVLLDNANWTFTVSTGSDQPKKYIPEYRAAKEIVKLLRGYEVKKELSFKRQRLRKLERRKDIHYLYSYYNKTVELTENGFNYIERLLGFRNITVEHFSLYKALLDTLEANIFFASRKGLEEYIVQDGKIRLIHPVNGRIMENCHKDDGLQLALELKENLTPTNRINPGVSMSYQIFYSKYKSMAGTSGTIAEAAKEFNEIYSATTVLVPMHSKNLRIDHKDHVSATKKEKYKSALGKVSELYQRGQPVLIVTGSEEESLLFSKMLYEKKIPHNVLNAQNTVFEDMIVRHAGKYKAVTISTNLASRGTDIIVDDKSEKIGGLFVLCLNHYENQRIDNQVRGRAGRQGQRGECQFFISAEDEILWHCNDKRQRLSRIPQYIVKIQQDLNMAYFEQRKMLLELEHVKEVQRQKMFDLKKLWSGYFYDDLRARFSVIISDALKQAQIALQNNNSVFLFGEKLSLGFDKEDILARVLLKLEKKNNDLGEKTVVLLLQGIAAMIINKRWAEFGEDLELLKQGIHLKAYTNPNIVTEYTLMAFSMFKTFEKKVGLEIVECYLNSYLSSKRRLVSNC